MENVNCVLEMIDNIRRHRVDTVYRCEIQSMLEHVECMIDNDDIEYATLELYIERLDLIKQQSTPGVLM